MPVSFKNQAIEDTMISLCDKHLCPPTVRQIAAAMGLKSHNAVMNHIKVLVREGRVEQLEETRSYMPVAWKDKVRNALLVGESCLAEASDH